MCVDRSLENLFAFIAGLDAELALKATQEKETRSRKEQSRGTRQRGEENRAPKEESKSNRQGDQEEDSKDTHEDLRAPQLQLRSKSPKPKRGSFQERRDAPFRSQALPFSRGAESVGRSRRTVTQNSKKSVQGPKSSPRSTATCAKPSLKEGSGKGGQGSPHSLPILKNSSPVETYKSTQPTGKKLTTAEGWMDPCAVPDEESGEGTVVTIYPSLPQSSFLGSGEQTLVAQQHGEDLESQDLRFACNTSCTPTIHMSTPTQKPLLDTGASHCLLPYSTLSKQNAEKARKIHLRVASGKPVRALMYQGVIYANSVERSLLSVGQLRDSLGLHFIWEDIHPVLLYPSFEDRKRYLLVQSFVEHNLPLITFDQMDMLLGALNLAIEDGKRWNRKEWEHYLEVDSLTPYHSFFDSVPATPTADVLYPAPSTFSSHQQSNRSCDRECDCEAQSKSSHVYPPGLSTPEEEHFEVQFSEAIKTLTNELLQHRPPLAPQRTNLASEERQPPRAQVFGGFTVRGRGMTSCTLKYPKILAAIHALAMLRPGAAKHEPYLSASLNEYSALPMHTDRSNYGSSWTISFGDYSGGGRLWIESPTGTRAPPCCNHEWEKKFRGEFVDTNMCWTKFDARIFHAVEPVKSGRRMSLTLFTPTGWEKIPDPIMSDILDHGFYPPTVTRIPRGKTVEDATPRLKRQAKAVTINLGHPDILFYPDSENGLAHGLFGTDSFRFDDIDPTTEESIEEQRWGADEGLFNPVALPSVDDGVLPVMTPDQHHQWQEHVQQGHLRKSYLCRGCILAEGPRRQHRTQPLPAVHTLHIDVAGPYTETTEGFQYFLVGALRMEGYPILLHAKMLKTRGAAEICARLGEMLAFFEGLDSEGFHIYPDQPRVRRIHSDRAKEFVTRPFQEFCTQKGIRLTTTAGYEPQSNGTAERAVGLIKSVASRCLHHAQLPHCCWNFAVQYAAQCFLLSALQQRQISPPFGSPVVAQVVNPKGERFPEGKSIEGRLLFWDHMHDKSSFLFVPDDSEDDFHVIRAKTPTITPPLVPDAPPVPPADAEAPVPEPLPALLPDPNDDDVIVEFDLDASYAHPPSPTPSPLIAEGNRTLPGASPEPPQEDNQSIEVSESECDRECDWEAVSSKLLVHDSDVSVDEAEVTLQESDPSIDLSQRWVLTTEPDEFDKDFVRYGLLTQAGEQATTHRPVTAKEILNLPSGPRRDKWIAACQKELGGLKSTRTKSDITLKQMEALKKDCLQKGLAFVFLPMLAVFTVKPGDVFKCRLVSCGNKTDETYGDISTNEMDVALLRFLLSWGVSGGPKNSFVSIDISTAFLNAELPEGRVVVVKPPACLYQLGLVPPGTVWRLHKALYGLRESPSLWAGERTKRLKSLEVTPANSSTLRLYPSIVHPSLWLVVKEEVLRKKPKERIEDVSTPVDREDVLGLVGVYVDDTLVTGPKNICEGVIKALQKLWKTGDPEFLTPSTPFRFLGVKVVLTKLGLYLHQHFYVDEFLKKHVGTFGTRVRGTTAAPESFSTKSSGEVPLKPDPENPQHQKQIKRAQQILGALLWLSTRTRPDLSYAVAMAASVQTRDLRDLEVRLRHLLQYVSSHPHLGLYYPYPTSNYRSLETFTDASFAPSGSHSHQGFAVLFKVGHSQHLLHWSSTRQKLVSQSSAEAELIALMSGFKATKSFQHLLSESVADLTPILRCDNQAVLAMLEKPSWRTRHISIRGEALRQAKDEKDVLITYVSTQNQVADPLTKPTSPQLNKGFYPKWGLVTLDASSGGVTNSERQRPLPVSREKKNK